MKQRNILTIGVLIVLACLFFWLLKPSQNEINQSPASQIISTQSIAPKSLSSNQITNSKTRITLPPGTIEREKEKRKQAIESIKQIFQTPITFHGKVIDQNGDPVPFAEIGYMAADKFNASGSNYRGLTDEKGMFSITGIKGAALTIGVRKEGYYHILDKSSGSFAYGTGPDSTHKAPPTQDNPAIFVLHKMGETEPLIKSENYVRVARDGTPIEIKLAIGQSVSQGQGDLRVEVWTYDQNVERGKPYDWRCRLSILNGGLVVRRGEFDFEAPANGYRPSDEIKMSAIEKEWRAEGSREYFIKFNDGRYARIHFTMIAGGNHYFKLESYLNPKPGSRSLEYDSKKQIK